MIKLKTLKDIEIQTSSNDGVEQTLIISTQAEYYTKLQIIAREWINELESGYTNEKDRLGFNKNQIKDELRDFACINDEGDEIYNLINWIEHFFNLEET